jgi:hypothetical protein
MDFGKQGASCVLISPNWTKMHKGRVNFLLFDNQLIAWRQLVADCLSKPHQFSTFRGLMQYPG